MNLRIHILLPIYISDKHHYLVKSVESLLKQTFQDFKIVFCLDGPISPENENYLNKIAKETNKCFFSRSSKAHGLPHALNKGIKEYPADIYFRMDADDICFPTRLEKQLLKFEEDPELLFVGTESIEIDEDDNTLFYKKLPSRYEAIKKFSYCRNPFQHPSWAFKQEFIERTGGYNEKYLKSQDYELVSRALIQGLKMTNLNEPLFYFRRAKNVFKRRRKWSNIKAEFLVSWRLIKHFKAYQYLPLVFAKLIMRFLPVAINEILYQKIR